MGINQSSGDICSFIPFVLLFFLDSFTGVGRCLIWEDPRIIERSGKVTCEVYHRRLKSRVPTYTSLDKQLHIGSIEKYKYNYPYEYIPITFC
jgi:hypothetical protein